MYRPKKYQKDDKEFLFSFIQKRPFASFITSGDRLMATHIPVLTEGDEDNWRLYSHVANHNKQLKTLKNGSDALIIFQGAHAYISSSLYKEKDISTWDYSAVHVNAKVRLQSPKELENSLQKLVEHFEKEQENPLFYQDIPRQMLKEHLPLITGFWLEPYKVEGIAKLHQSYAKQDIEAVVNHLSSSGDSIKNELAQAMKKENSIK